MPFRGSPIIALTARVGASENRHVQTANTAVGQPLVALLDYSQLLEDYLDSLGVSFETFRDEMSGGWLFGYMAALQLAGVGSVLFCVSARVDETSWYTHKATGQAICLLSASRSYRAVRRRVLNPYADNLEKAMGRKVRGICRVTSILLKELAPYLATPLGALAREVRRAGCTAIICQEYEHARFDACLLLGRLMGLPVFASFQGGDYSISRLERVVRGPAVRAAAGLIIGSEREARRIRSAYRVDGEKIWRIFNPLDLTQWQPANRAESRSLLGISPHARVAVWHGRVMMARKGLDILLEAWTQVWSSRPNRNLLLLLVGTGRDAPKLRQRIDDLGVRGVLWLNEFVTDRNLLLRYVSAADVCVLPSRHEGFPVAPIEAMACGLPLVAANAPGVADIIEGGERSGGVIVKRGDARALADALGRILDEESWCRELGARARRRVEDGFSLEVVGKQLRDALALTPGKEHWRRPTR